MTSSLKTDHNMSSLLVLSTELLIQVLATSDSIPDVLRFSAANRRLHSVWMAHSTQIIETVVRTSIPPYEKAVDLAVTETQLQCSMDDRPLLRYCLPTLLQNANLCASACLAYSAVRDDDPSPPTSYYFLRQVGVGYM